MKPAPFEYDRPESLPETLDLLAEHGEDAKPLAGGQSLLPLLAMRLAQPARLVDLERVRELRGAQVSDGELRIGAMTTESDVERSAAELDLPAAIREAIPHIGHFQIRNRGTVGGSIAHADPAAEWPALLLLLDGSVGVASRRGHRTVTADSFLVGPLTTGLQPDELVVDIRIPHSVGPSAFAEVARRHGDFALVGAACDSGRVVAFGTGSRPQRLIQVEAYLASGGRALADVVRIAEEEIDAAGDLHAPAAYRKKVGGQLVAQVVGRCLS